jgi:hypothetical protein
MDPRDKLRPKFKLRSQECLDIAKLSKAYPHVNVYNQGEMASTEYGRSKRNEVFQWALRNETHDPSDTALLHTSRTEVRPILKGGAMNPLLITDSYLPLTTVEDQVHLDEVSKAQLVAKDAIQKPLDKAPIKRLGVTMGMFFGAIVLFWWLTKK